MDTLQARFRDQATEILQNNATISVAVGRGQMFNIETCYVVGHSDEIYCIVKANPALVEAVQDDARVAFAVTKGFPNRMLQGTGRAFFLGRLDQHPQVREQTLTKSPDAAPFLTTIRNLGVLQILPDRIAITDDTNLGLGPRPIYLPEAARALPSWWSRWLQATGASAWSLSVIPVLVAILLARVTPGQFTWWLVIPVIAAALLLHMGTTLLAERQDFQRHIERSEALGASHILAAGLLPTHQVLGMGICCLLLSVGLGLFLVGQQGLPLLLLGLVGVAGGLFYAGWPLYLPHREVDEAILFLGLGPLLVIGASYGLTGAYDHSYLLVSLPIGCLACAILHASHLRTLPDDAKANRRTLAVVLGWEPSRQLYYGLIGLPYILTVVLILTGVLPGLAWLVFLSLPLAARCVAAVWRATPLQTVDLAAIDRQTAQVHLAFGGLLVVSVLVSWAI
jgi:1,4-dihydroxy-2-naphthoate polyprenyltransferase